MRLRSIKEKSAVCSLQSAVCPPRAGFTLLELMTVMVIMFILMGMATLALRGVVRGTGISGAVSNARAVLTQARQHAIITQRPTGTLFLQQGATNVMVVVARYAKATVNSTRLHVEEELPWTATVLNGTRVFNMTTGRAGILQGNSLNPGSMDVFESNIPWKNGDEAGFMVGDERHLPGGMEFGTLPNPPIVIFNTDGTARADYTIALQEKFVSGAAAEAILIQVRQNTGWVEVE